MLTVLAGTVLAGTMPAMLGACRVETDSELKVLLAEGGAGGAEPVGVKATWEYRSGDVDIDASLKTEFGDGNCVTTGRLVVNKAGSKPERYYTDSIPCGSLRLTETGDLLLHGVPTGHDWSTEELKVNRDRERLALGPWSPPEDPDAAHRFELSAPGCGGCACPQIVRKTNGEQVQLVLGRDCD